MSESAIPRELIDADAQKVIRHLVRNGYQAYLVGGCVRDLLLGRTPKDFDVATSATPAEIRDLFRNCRIIGRRFRLAHVVFGRKIIETATFRANPRPDGLEPSQGEDDSAGELYIHRDNVFGNAEEDARRRDFTINGLFYDLESGRVIDYVGGMDDLVQRHLRTIGDPNIRFREDPVRILRAVKFAARLSFDVEDFTYRAMISHHSEVQKSAAPRVLEEIYRLLRSGAAVESMVLMSEIGLLGLLLPEVSGWLRDRPAVLDSYLGLLDARVQAGEMPSNAALLIVLAAPALAPLFDDATAPRDLLGFIESTFDPMAARLRVARRDVERVRQTLVAQRRIAQTRKRGARLPAGLIGRDYAGEAMGLHALFYCAERQAAGESLESALAEVRAWPLPQPLRLGESSEELGGEGGRREGPAGEEGERRRRRRRGSDDGESRGSSQSSRPGSEGAEHGQHDAGGDLPHEVDEDAVIAAYTAALNRHDEE